MTTIGIIGGGQGATLHADAVLHTRGVGLIGVGGRPGSAGRLADEAGVPDLPLAALCEADAVVVAVPPPAVEPILRLIENEALGGAPVRAILVEPPVRALPDGAIPTALGANLLHAPVVRQAMREITALPNPHHLQLRCRQPQPTWGAHGTADFGGPLEDPGVRLASLLLAAAGEPAVHVEQTEVAGGVHAAIELESGRRVGLEVAWVEGSSRIELEAADEGGVILLTLDPLPRLEIDGKAIEAPDLHPLEALGFTAQIDRLGRTAKGSAPWPEATAGLAIEALLSASSPA